MDKLDEWMKRAFNSDSGIQKQSSAENIERKPFSSQNKGKPFNPQNKQWNKKRNKNAKNFKNFGARPEKNTGNFNKNPQKPLGNFNKNHGNPKNQRHSEPQKSHGNQRHPENQKHIPGTQRNFGNQKNQKTQKNHEVKPNFKNQGNQNKQVKPLRIKAKKAEKIAQILPGKLKIIPLGGLGEIGKNMLALQYEHDIIIVDMGFEFPSEDLYGVDYVIPDVTYLEENKKLIRGVIITHGHLDHTGAIPYILPKLDFPPVYGMKLTLGLIQKRIEEFKLEKMVQLREIKTHESIRLGAFLCSFFRVAHSIPDSIGTIIGTPIGKVVYTGDFKFDETPARNIQKAEIHKIEALGKENVLALFCESTNAIKEGHSISEQQVGQVIEDIVKNAPGRIIIASFASQIGRIQQIIDAAMKYNRKVFVSGKSMRDNIEISAKIGYINYPKDRVLDVKKYKKVPDNETLILTTGSQGEDVSALTRMSNNEHQYVKIKKGDTIVLSSSPIIGNERAIFSVINSLSMMGAKVIHNQIMDVHTSGHAKKEELKRMISTINPKYLIPIHGEYYMRQTLAEIGHKDCGIPEDRIIMIQNGDILLGEKDKIYISNEKIETKYILIDGLGEGQIDSQVQMEREIMSKNGALIVLIHIDKKTKKLKKTPDIVSRGFIYMQESEEIMREMTEVAEKAYKDITGKRTDAPRKDIKRYIQQTIDRYATRKIERRPLIIPLILES